MRLHLVAPDIVYTSHLYLAAVLSLYNNHRTYGVKHEGTKLEIS